MNTKTNGTRTILIVDDEPDIVSYMEMLLQDAGFRTVSAEDGQVGFEKVKGERPDLVCLDINMPKESGVRLYRDMRDDPELATIPVLVVTAITGLGGDPEPFRKFLSTRKSVPPPDGFFPKPIDAQALVAKIRELLGG